MARVLKDGKLYVYNHNGTTLTVETSYTIGAIENAAPTIADVDNDGALEIVMGNMGDDKVYVLSTGSQSTITWDMFQKNLRNTGYLDYPFAAANKEDAYGLMVGTSSVIGIINEKGLSASLPSGWEYVVLTYDKNAGSNQLKLYVNGTLTTHSTLTDAISINTNNLTIGDCFNGTIDEVRIYNRALSPEEIMMHFQSEFQKYNATHWYFYDNVTDLPDGTHTYYGWAKDMVRNPGQTEMRTLTIDTTAPTITIDTPTTSLPVYRKGGGLFWVNFTYTELNPKNYTVEIMNSTAVINSSVNANVVGGTGMFANVSFNLNESAAEGQYNVTVTMYDNASNYNVSYENYSVVKDDVEPDIFANATDYLAGQTAAKQGDEITINAYVTATVAGVKNVSVNVSAINATENNVTLQANGTGTNRWNYTLIVNGTDLNDTYSLPIYAWDNASNFNGTETLEVKVDNAKPSVISNTNNVWVANGSTVILNATVTDPSPGSGVKNATVNVSGINSTINEAILTNQSGYWINDSIIADVGGTGGLVNLAITAYDNVSLCNDTINMTVGIDEGAPNVTAITLNQWVANGSTVILNASITDLRSGVKNATVNVSAINSTINEAILETQDGNYWTNTTIIADGGDTGGLKNLTITAYDNVSLCNNTINMTVGIDETPPIVTAIEPINSYVVNGSTLELNVSVTDTASGVNASAVWVNVSRINNTLGNFSLDRVGTTNYWNGSIIVNTTNEGTQNLTVYAYDNVSNCNSSVNLTVYNTWNVMATLDSPRDIIAGTLTTYNFTVENTAVDLWVNNVSIAIPTSFTFSGNVSDVATAGTVDSTNTNSNRVNITGLNLAPDGSMTVNISNVLTHNSSDDGVFKVYVANTTEDDGTWREVYDREDNLTVTVAKWEDTAYRAPIQLEVQFNYGNWTVGDAAVPITVQSHDEDGNLTNASTYVFLKITSDNQQYATLLPADGIVKLVNGTNSSDKCDGHSTGWSVHSCSL